MRQYENAEMCRNKADQMEQYERQFNQDSIEGELIKQERALRKRQQMALATLLKRIQRDREE